MSAESLNLLALACFAAGALAALMAFRVEALRSNALQFGAAGLGMLFKSAGIGMACAQSHTHFFNSPSEMIGLLAWSLGFSYLVALAVSAARSLGALIMPLVAALILASLFISKEPVGIEIPGQRLFTVHVLSAFLGYGLFLTACGASLLYLEQSRLLKRKIFGAIFRDLPSLERLERLEMVCSWLGLAVFSVALATGAVLAGKAGRPFWLEAKFLSAQVTWLVFLALVLGRAARRLSGRTAAKFALAGAALVLLTLALGHPLGRPRTAHGEGEARTSGKPVFSKYSAGNFLGSNRAIPRNSQPLAILDSYKNEPAGFIAVSRWLSEAANPSGSACRRVVGKDFRNAAPDTAPQPHEERTA